jgi:dienelactone hydrolase
VRSPRGPAGEVGVTSDPDESKNHEITHEYPSASDPRVQQAPAIDHGVIERGWRRSAAVGNIPATVPDEAERKMAHVLLFHHAQGLTEGVVAFADELRQSGHEVTVPDLYDGRVFPTLDEGVAYAHELGFGAVIEAGVEVAQRLPQQLVYAGFSLGALPAQRLAQRRPQARGALLYHSAAPIAEFSERWPDGVPLQMHIMVDDPWDDLEVMQDLQAASGGELFTYDGHAHLFTDRSRGDHDPVAARLVMERTQRFLADVGP